MARTVQEGEMSRNGGLAPERGGESRHLEPRQSAMAPTTGGVTGCRHDGRLGVSFSNYVRQDR